ncbi:MAG TPA: 3-oxoacyl-ACP reductase family protein [Ilumatobacter sp.]|nr:3-oxoacyl-ACP reductase family protein [Ilumatobacter sp.]
MTDGRVALVAGGTRGIGRAISERLVADGWHVLATYRTDDATADEFAARHDRLSVRRADIASTSDCSQAVAQAVAVFGSLDHLVCNAAISRDSRLVETSDADWDAVLDTNLSGVFRMIRAALPSISASANGRVVTVSSVAATMGNSGQAAYAASKAGLLGLTRTLAREVADQGVTVNIVMPGPTAETGMTADADAAFVAAISRKIPLRRLGRPEEVAHAVRFLLDDLAAFTTGSVITVDGGLSM